MNIYFPPRVNWLKNISRYSQCYQVVTKSADNIFTVRKLYKSASLLLQYVRQGHQLISGVSARLNGGSVCLSVCLRVRVLFWCRPSLRSHWPPRRRSLQESSHCVHRSLCLCRPNILRQFLFDVWFFQSQFYSEVLCCRMKRE